MKSFRDTKIYWKNYETINQETIPQGISRVHKEL